VREGGGKGERGWAPGRIREGKEDKLD